MNPKIIKAWSPFFILWVLVNIVGWACCSIAFIRGYFPGGSGAGLGAMILLSLLQGYALRKQLHIDAMWFWASLLTYTAFFIACFSGFFPDKQIWLMVAIFLLGLVGITQKTVLRYYLPRENTWLFVSPAAGLIAMLAAGAIAGNPHQLAQEHHLTLLYWSIFGFCYGLITGTCLVWMSSIREVQGDSSQ